MYRDPVSTQICLALVTKKLIIHFIHVVSGHKIGSVKIKMMHIGSKIIIGYFNSKI